MLRSNTNYMSRRGGATGVFFGTAIVQGAGTASRSPPETIRECGGRRYQIELSLQMSIYRSGYRALRLTQDCLFPRCPIVPLPAATFGLFTPSDPPHHGTRIWPWISSQLKTCRSWSFPLGHFYSKIVSLPFIDRKILVFQLILTLPRAQSCFW